MARILIIAIGSRGDVQPYAALGAALVQRGHRVRFATLENFEPLARRLGLDFHPVKGDAQALMNSAGGQAMTRSGQNPLALMRAIMRTFGGIVEDYVEAFSAPALRDTDLIINQLPGGLFGYDLAEALGVPHIVASVIPLVPTRTHAQVMLSTRSYGALLNGLTHTFAAGMVWSLFRKPVNRFRDRLGLRPAPLFGHLGAPERRRDPVINGFSPHVVPPPDWGAHVHTTGWWLLDETDWQPSDALTAFLDAGDPPVFVGFGSMPVPDPATATALIVEAARRAGARVVLGSGWSKADDGALPEFIFRLDYAPYQWLFPRMSAIVHHGGSGTTGYALRSGVPSLVASFVADQPYWGKRTADLGVGPASIPFKDLTIDTLANAITTMRNDTRMRERAAALGEVLRAEPGLVAAVEVVERTLMKRSA
jgi:UDP:flavonoid glycosyltransferase YjiC (YdhE family)